MQNKVTGLKQAQTNTETSLSLLQTAEAAMAEGVDILNQMKQLAFMQQTKRRMTACFLKQTRWNLKNCWVPWNKNRKEPLLQEKNFWTVQWGSQEVLGNHLRFVEAKIDTPGSPTEGFKIDITQPAPVPWCRDRSPFRWVIYSGLWWSGAKGAELDSTKEVDEELQKIRKSHVDDPERFEEQVNKEIQQIIIHQLNERFEKQGLLDAMLSPEGHIITTSGIWNHTSFSTTSACLVLTKKVGEAENSIPGKDVAGSIAGDPSPVTVSCLRPDLEPQPRARLSNTVGKQNYSGFRFWMKTVIKPVCAGKSHPWMNSSELKMTGFFILHSRPGISDQCFIQRFSWTRP